MRDLVHQSGSVGGHDVRQRFSGVGQVVEMTLRDGLVDGGAGHHLDVVGQETTLLTGCFVRCVLLRGVAGVGIHVLGRVRIEGSPLQGRKRLHVKAFSVASGTKSRVLGCSGHATTVLVPRQGENGTDVTNETGVTSSSWKIRMNTPICCASGAPTC
jgi:hypothetical protein